MSDFQQSLDDAGLSALLADPDFIAWVNANYNVTQSFFTVLTDVGLAAFTNAKATNASVNITQMAIGAGLGGPDQEHSKLRDEKWRGNVMSIAPTISDPRILQCEVRVPPEVGGWTARECGLFDEDNNLIAIGSLPPSYKPALESGAAKDLLVRMYIQHSNAAAVTLKIDPAIIMASQSFVNEKIATQSLRSGAAMMVALTEQQYRYNQRGA